MPLAVRWNARSGGLPNVSIGIPTEKQTARTAKELESLLREMPSRNSKQPGAGWFGWISYDAGACLEPAVRVLPAKAVADREWPLASFQRIESSVVFDSAAKWREAGLAGGMSKHILSQSESKNDRQYAIERIDASVNRDQYITGAQRIIEYIRAGDAYQVNLAHRLSATFSGSSRHLFADLAETAQPWHGGYFEGDGYALASASPELFLDANLQTGEVRTRPMKGTRAYTAATDSAARLELDESKKDRAELAMIVDLMRNDLGRVCELGSVRVEQQRRIEKHASGVFQSTATIAGKLRSGTKMFDLLRATFPPGSVTGAPKIRAMQIIDELEPVRRGPYCGSMIWIGDDGRVQANVMIRTASLSQARSTLGSGQLRGDFKNAQLDYFVGAGIVADSDPETEWQETLDKATAFTQLR